MAAQALFINLIYLFHLYPAYLVIAITLGAKAKSDSHLLRICVCAWRCGEAQLFLETLAGTQRDGNAMRFF